MGSAEQWIRHFKEMAQGKIRPTASGRWILKDYDTSSPSGEPASPVQIVSQTQQAVEQAKTTRKRKRKEDKKRTYAKPSRSWRNF